MAENWETLQVSGADMRAFICAPDGAGPHPAMVVIQHAGGVDTFVQEMTRRTAAAGYLAIAPDLYHRLDPSSGADNMTRMGTLRDENLIPDVNAAVEWLQRASSATDSIGIVGFCMGGRVALLGAAVNPAIGPAISYYGGNTMVSWGDAGPTPFERLGGIRGPVLAFFGEDDPNPSQEDMLKIGAQLKEHGIQHEFHSFSDSGHAYMDFTTPGRHREYASTASWSITVDFMAKHLG